MTESLEINDVVSHHAKLTEQYTKVLTLGRQALPIWKESNDTTVNGWLGVTRNCAYLSNDAMTNQSLENYKVIGIKIVNKNCVFRFMIIMQYL